MRTNYRPAPSSKVWHIKNDHITAPMLRVLDESGHQIGVISKQESLQKARDEGKDLVLIAPKANPPVAKIIDFKKFLYQEKKRQQETKKGVKKSSVKDVQLSLFIAEGDKERLSHKASEFLKNGFQVRIKLTLRGRELGKRPMALDLVASFIAGVPNAVISTPPKFQGRVLVAVISKQKNQIENENKKVSVETL